ncbi:MAG TPA: hypothetical protein VG755_27565, partial [Nannocystaceae bacterium]|nr:hypothetical protein [Nannocystaceae bacterium]
AAVVEVAIDPMPIARTHRELYRAAVEIAQRHAAEGRALETWLRALLGLVPRVALLEELDTSELLRMIDEAFVAPPVQFDPAWSALPPVAAREGALANDVVRALQRQIWELHELARTGSLRKSDRVAGVEAPGGGQWFNTDPTSFIEAGLQGAFGGYALEESSRMGGTDVRNNLLAGQSGEIMVRAIPMTHVTWDDVHSLLVCGQCYV